MVFPSLPIYLDPTNWSQRQARIEIGTQNSLPLQLPPASTVASTVTAEAGGSYQGFIRPGSMADRARMSKIHQNEVAAAQKCPRCESTNTKFCYYNNYNLSQPRHFCKTCRRYWTRGGTLRNVPVGGGCRRNKRSKVNSISKSSTSKPNHDHRSVGTGVVAGVGGSSSTGANASSNNGCIDSNVNVGMAHFQTQFPFLSSLNHFNNNDYVSGGIGSLMAKNISNSTTTSVEFQLGNGSSLGNSNVGSLFLSNGIGEQWRFSNPEQVHHHPHQQQQQRNQQFPFLTNLEPQIGLFQFGSGENNEPPTSFIHSKAIDSSSVGIGTIPQVNNIKMEENNHQVLSLPKNLLSGSGNSNDIFWNGNGNSNANAWNNEVPSFTPSPSQLL